MMNQPKATPVDGILLVNKPQGMSSNKVLQKAKRMFGATKAGHTGSLDPLATGMLPVCFGEATKICQYLLDADKAYETTGMLGVKTDTSDATGAVIATVSDFSISDSDIQCILQEYRGTSKQVPSMYSALKHKGMPLYYYARQGLEVEREARDIVISQLELTGFDGTYFSLNVHCSKGTYIRNLVEDIGDALGVGAHVTRLHRPYTGGFVNQHMYTLEELECLSMDEKLACLLPMDEAIGFMPQVVLNDDQILALRQGRIVTNLEHDVLADCLKIYDTNQRFIGLGAVLANGDLKVKRLLAFS